MATSKRDTYHHGALRETLIDLAMEMLETSGPDGLSLRLLATRAGVSGMAPYRHFADRSALLRDVARRGFALLADDLPATGAMTDARERLAAFGIAYVEFASRRPGLFMTMFGAAPPTPDEDVEDPNSVRARFAALIAELAPPEKRDDLFLTCWAAMHGLACLCLAGRVRGSGEPPAALASRVTDVLQGLFAAGSG